MTTQLETRFDDDAVTAVAGFGIPGSQTFFPADPLPAGSWSRLLESARSNGLVGLLAAAVDAEALATTTGQRQQLDAARRESETHRELTDLAVADAADTLATAGIETRIIDGPAVAHLDYTNPVVRTYRAAELLLPPAALEQASTFLLAGGHLPRPASSQPERRNQPSVLRLTAPNGTHLTLLDRPRWMAGTQVEIWQRSESFDVAGRSVLALAREERLIDTCWRATVPNGDSLGTFRDLAEAALHPKLDAHRALALADRLGVLSRLAVPVRSVWSELRLADVVMLSTWAQSWSDDRHRRSTGAGSGTAPLARFVRAFAAIPGMRR